MALPPYIALEDIAERLPHIFPLGTPNRTKCIGNAAARTIFVALYIGAIEGADHYLAPVHVYRMTDEQAARSSDNQRTAYGSKVTPTNVVGQRWYADNSREPIRDEALRDGLVPIGAVTRRDDLPTTSNAGRYALKADFAALFNPTLTGANLTKAITAFRSAHLSPSALARVSIMLSGATGSTSGVLVRFPSGETRQLAPGTSSLISQAVVEVFARKFLDNAAVLWLSESGNKVVMRDDRIAAAIGLKIEADKNLPDLILADLGPPDPIIVFVEVVATDGPITPRRQRAIYDLTDAAGFKRDQVAFLTAYLDREAAGFKKTVTQLAWRSFSWFVSEPDHIIILRDGAQSPVKLSALL